MMTMIFTHILGATFGGALALHVHRADLITLSNLHPTRGALLVWPVLIVGLGAGWEITGEVLKLVLKLVEILVAP